MIKIENETYKSSPRTIEYKNKIITIIKDNNSIESEISSILGRFKEEINNQNQKLKYQKSALNKIKIDLKNEQSKFSEINNDIIIIAKEIENIEVNCSRINKKKLYNMSSIIKLKYMFKSSNISKKCIFLLNTGFNGEIKNLEYLDLIIDNDNDEFCYYLKYLEKTYKNMEKENKEEFIKLKNEIKDCFENGNLSYPYDKLLLYLNCIVQNIDLSNSLKEKFDKLKEKETKKNIIDIKIRNLEFEKTEKQNLIKEINKYIELLKKIMEKYLHYRKQYKNHSISKEILSKKIKKIQSINIENWNPENKNKIYLGEKKNNNLIKYSTISDNKNKSAIFTIENETIVSKHHKQYESKSQTNSRNISFDYLSKFDGPLIKRNSIEKINIPKTIFDTLSNFDSDKENVSENNDSESPISKINIISRKKNTIHVYKKKLSFQIMKNHPISPNINCFNPILKKNDNQNIDSKTIYISKNNSINLIKDKKTSSTSRIYKDSEDDIIPQNKKVINKKKFIFTDEESKNNNKSKGLYFLKKIKKNKKFLINKDKLFNKDLPKKIKINSLKNKNNFKFLQKNEEIEITNKNIINKGKKNLTQEKKIYFNTKGRNDNNKIFCSTNSIKFFENNLNFELNRDTKNIFYGINSKKCTDSIKIIKDEMKKRNLLSINTSGMNRGLYKKNEIKADFKRDNCCISCT